MVQLTTLLAIDPGSEQSAWLLYGSELDRPRQFAIDSNDELLRKLRAHDRWGGYPSVVVIEQVESYGMPVGREVFETVRWSGRFEEASRPTPVVYLPRRAVKLHLCGSARAKDANIRQALLDRFGPQGTKRSPGALYGISKDVWSALALAVTYSDGGGTE